MTQQELIEKLGALPRWWALAGGESKLVLDAYAVGGIILQAKAEQSEPVAFINVEKRNLEWAKPIVFHTALCGSYPKVPLYTAPQPTPQDVIDAERYRELLRQETGLRYAQKPVIKSAIDQAMKGQP